MVKEKIYNIPNALSAYRLFIFPFVLFLLFRKNENLFSIFIAINLFTDFLDGFIARTFNMVTKFGARLDSLADYGTFLLAFFGLFVFKRDDLNAHGWILYLFILLLVVSQIINIYKFGTFSSLHLYSFKTTGYLQGVLFILWFFVGFFPAYYYFAIGFGVLAELELITTMLVLKEKCSNARGIYWVLKGIKQ